MMTRIGAAAAILILALASTACTGGSETRAADETKAAAEVAEQQQQQRKIDAHRELNSISRAIPIYHGAQFHDDLTKRDEIMIRNKYGAGAKVYTMATDDSFPQVYHYYTTYLGQYGAFEIKDTYPPKQQNWRSLEVVLNQAMQDPFIPGTTIDANGRQVTLQIAETEAEPKTVIRYIVAPPAPAAAPGTAPLAAPVAATTAAPVAR